MIIQMSYGFHKLTLSCLSRNPIQTDQRVYVYIYILNLF